MGKYDWKCEHTASIVSETDTTATIRVTGYWRNSGWTYNMTNSIWASVYCGTQNAQILSNGGVNSTTTSTTGRVSLGYKDFEIEKTTAAQSISCYAIIDSTNSYCGDYTRKSTATTVTVPAKVSQNHLISFDANGGTGGITEQTKVQDEKLVLSNDVPTRNGYQFLGWNENSDASFATYSPSEHYCTDRDITLYAIWRPLGKTFINQNTEVKKGTAWHNAGGNWVTGDIWKNENGTWKKGIKENRDGLIGEVVLTGISVSNPPNSRIAIMEEPIDLTGMEITATYSDGSQRVVTGWTKRPSAFTVLTSPQDVTISYTEGGVTATTTYSMIVYTA